MPAGIKIDTYISAMVYLIRWSDLKVQAVIFNKQSQEYISLATWLATNPTLIGGQKTIGLETAKPMQLLKRRFYYPNNNTHKHTSGTTALFKFSPEVETGFVDDLPKQGYVWVWFRHQNLEHMFFKLLITDYWFTTTRNEQ